MVIGNKNAIVSRLISVIAIRDEFRLFFSEPDTSDFEPEDSLVQNILCHHPENTRQKKKIVNFNFKHWLYNTIGCSGIGQIRYRC